MKRLLFLLLLIPALAFGQDVYMYNSKPLIYNNKIITYPDIPYYSDFNFWIEGRSGLTLPDVFGNDATILTPVYKSSNSSTHCNDGDKTRVDEHIFDGDDYTFYLSFLPDATNSRIFLFGGATANAKRGIEVRKSAAGSVQVWADDNIVNRILNTHSGLTLTGWCEIHIQVNGTTKQMISTIVHAGGTSGPTTLDISSFTFNTNDNDVNYKSAYSPYATYNIKKFTGLVTLANCRLDGYVTGLQMWFPEFISGTDVSGNGNHFYCRMNESDKFYTDKTTYLLDKGYSIYKRADVNDFYIPHDINGTPITRIFLSEVAANRFVLNKSVDGNDGYFNLADAMIEFQGDVFDRSDTDIYTDEARLNYYDVANPKRWHSEEINRLIMNDYFNNGYKGLVFPKCESNSYEDRDYLKEIFAYNTNKTGNKFNAVLSYTGDLSINSMIYLKTPYTQVPLITAVENSEFTIQINNDIYYSYADIKEKTDLIQVINGNEDFMSGLFRWLMSNSAYEDKLLSLYQSGFVIANEDGKYLRLPFLFMNSYPYGQCLELAQFAYAIVKNYSISNNSVWRLGGVGHAVNNNADAYMDLLYGILLYSDRYETVNATEIEADKYLWTEPIRIYDEIYRQRAGTAFDEDNWNELVGGGSQANLYDIPAIDNLTMLLPANATLIFPVQTANIPQNDQSVNLDCYNQAVITATTGIVGDVDMPFLLLQITGTGTVVVDEITYNLPANEAALKAVLQGYAKFYHSFEITANTGGIVAEYLVSPRLLQLYKNNTYSLTTISGSVTVGKATTASAVPTRILSIETNNEDVLWSMSQDRFQKSTSILAPMTGEAGNERRFIYFYKDGLRPPLGVALPNTINAQVVIAGTPVYDDCFAPIMTPKADDFVGSLEITLISVDDANIYYTTDGSDPDATDILYTTPFTISATTTIKAICIKADYGDSNIISRVITKL